MRHYEECTRTVDGLGEAAAALTGLTTRLAAALAHLRDAWTIADATNKPIVELSIGALVHAFNRVRGGALAHRVLEYGLGEETGRELWRRAQAASLDAQASLFLVDPEAEEVPEHPAIARAAAEAAAAARGELPPPRPLREFPSPIAATAADAFFQVLGEPVNGLIQLDPETQQAMADHLARRLVFEVGVTLKVRE